MKAHPMARLMPKSLVGRVFALYAFTLCAFVGGGAALFYQYQFAAGLEKAQERADTLIAVVLPAVSDSAVIGDYDTIRRTLQRAVYHSDFASAAYIDRAGGMISEIPVHPTEVRPPDWLRNRTAKRLYDTNSPVTVGGRDYGVLRLSFSPEHIAGDLWRQARVVMALALASLLGGLLLIRFPLVSWLGELGHLEDYEKAMQTGVPARKSGRLIDTATEFQETFAVLDRAAASLQAQRDQASTTLAAIGDGVFTFDAHEKVFFVNPVACIMMGLTQEAIIGQSVRSLCPDVFTDSTTLMPWRDRRTMIYKADRPPMVVETTLSPMEGPAGQPAGYVLASRDITERHALDQQLQDELESRQTAIHSLRQVLEGLVPQTSSNSDSSASLSDLDTVTRLISSLVMRLQERNEQLHAIFELSPDGFVSFDAHQHVNYVSPAFAWLTGLPGASMHGLHESAFAARLAAQCGAKLPLPGLDPARKRHPAKAVGPSKRQIIEIEHPTKRVLEMRMQESQSQAISQVFYLRDVTHETAVERMKSEFLSTAAHELRTPMANIFGYAELMINRDLTPTQQKDFIKIIYRQTELMICIINELLDLERIEARGGKDFRLENIDLSSVAATVARDFKPLQSRQSPLITASTLSMPVRIDRNKMTQALGNVLSNAYKYSPGGAPVNIDFVARVDSNSEDQVGVRVADGGIGMSADQLARVSERFYRADTSGKIPGTGLGMSIVKEIIELMGGSLELQSEAGVGTQVTLWLPLAPSLLPVPA